MARRVRQPRQLPVRRPDGAHGGTAAPWSGAPRETGRPAGPPDRLREAAEAAGSDEVLGLDPATAVELLAAGVLEIVGRLVVSSNNAMLGTVTLARPGSEPLVAPCVYKPTRGERPLWDFPDGTLARREVAAFALSEASRWSIVPPTVLRSGPFGEGMVQLWLEPDPSADAVALVVEGDERLRPIALFDVIANNADRKVGHLLPMTDGRVFGVDHGICFHAEPKLRTVLWRWRGEPLSAVEVATLRRLRSDLDGDLGRTLGRLLRPSEIRATALRLHRLLVDGCFPHPDPDRPAIPWPPY